MRPSRVPPNATSNSQVRPPSAALNVMQQMQYGGNIPIPSRNGTGLMSQGGGVVPPALLEESRVPRFYHEALASCGAVSVSQLPNTALVYNLMVTSRLPRPVLGNIWSLVNRTLPGQLTRQEFFSCLALIALVQRGQSLSALSTVSVLPIPHLQACAPLPGQSLQAQPNSHFVSVVQPSCSAMPTSVQHTQPTSSISLNQLTTTAAPLNFSANTVIAKTQQNPPSFSTSWNLRQPSTAGQSLQKSDCFAGIGSLDSFAQFSKSKPSNFLMNFGNPLSSSSAPVTPASQPVAQNGILDSSSNLHQNTNSKAASLPSAEPKVSANTCFAKSDTNADLFCSFQTAVNKTSAVECKDIDLLTDIVFPTTSTPPTTKTSAVANTTSPLTLLDQFGDFATSETNSAYSTASASPLQPSVSNNVQPALQKPAENDKLDIYAAVKAVEGTLEDNKNTNERIQVWQRCIEEAHSLFHAADVLLPPFAREQIAAVARTEKGAHYFSALEAIYETVSRIRKGRSLELANEEKRLHEIDGIWSRLKDFVEPQEACSQCPLNGVVAKSCGICLTNIAENLLLEFAGTAYHKQCANLWINRVNSLLPKLS